MNTIAVLSDTRLPTLSDGSHGLGRSAHDIATGLARAGCTVTLYAAPGSEFVDGRLVTHADEHGRALWLSQADSPGYDAILDTTHHHKLSRLRPEWPILNRICDREATYTPPNAVVNSRYMAECYPGARLVATGINTADIPFYPHAVEPLYLAFGGNPHDRQRGYEIAKRVADSHGLLLKVATDLTGREKWDWLGSALALLSPSLRRAAPRLPLEAAAVGTPTVCLDGDGCSHHVQDGVTGFVCREEAEMGAAVGRAAFLDRLAIREWVEATHGYEEMIDCYRQLLAAVAGGDGW